MPPLRNSDLAVIEPEKLFNYCLDPGHPDGRYKARVFKAALGFDRSNYLDLLRAIRAGILQGEAVRIRETPHGELWRVDLAIVGPGGRSVVRTGWIYEKGVDVPRLTTAFVVQDT